MNGTHEARKHWLDKAALFGLFIVALLIARFIVTSRSTILLSEPIELDYGGLSVSIPTGNGWQREKQWKYQENAFTLGSFFTMGSGSIDSLVSCRYRLAAPAATADMLLEEKASATGGVIAKTGQIEISGPTFSFAKSSQNRGILTIDWAHIKKPKTLFDTFFGIVRLPSNHQLDIEVYQTTGDMDLAEGLFKSITESLKFTDNKLLEAGSQIATEIKDEGPDSFLASADNKQGEGKESFFLIKDAVKRPIGFTMEVVSSRPEESPQNGDTSTESVPEARLNITIGSFYYIRGNRQATLFQSNNDFSEFIWKSETSSPAGRKGTEILLSKDGIMTIRKFNRQFEEKDYQISSAAIPDALSELVLKQMLDIDRKATFVDIISAEGKITPTFITKIEKPGQSVSQNRSNITAIVKEGAAYAFRVELLDGRGFSEQVYLDDEGQVSGRLLQQDGTYTIERTNAEDILREFPEEGSYILQRKDEVFEQSKLLEDSE